MKEKLSIIKISGNIIDKPKKMTAFLQDFTNLKDKKILVHGGGKIASELSKKMGVVPKMYKGRRITDNVTLEIITMIYAGLLNKRIIAELQAKCCNAIGLSGADANTISAVKRPVGNIDYGFVGDIVSINSDSILKLINADFIPVFNAITHNNNGQLLNTNADSIASELAVGMSDEFDIELIYLFEKNGVLSDLENNIVIETIDKEDFVHLQKNGIVKDGMIPKLNNCFYALENGVKSIKIAGEGFLSTNNQIHTKIL